MTATEHLYRAISYLHGHGGDGNDEYKYCLLYINEISETIRKANPILQIVGLM